MKELVEYIAKSLVDYPEQVDVQQVEGGAFYYSGAKGGT